MVIFCSDEVSEVMHPPRPLNGNEVVCGEGFETWMVHEALKARRELAYGVVVIDGSEATLGIVQASATGSGLVGGVSKIAHLSAHIASRTRRGGQSAARFSRNRDTEELAFLRKVAETAGEALGDVRGLVVAGRADMKRKFVAELSSPLRSRVARVVDLQCCAGLEGLQKAAAHLCEVVQKDREQETCAAVSRFLGLVARTDAHAAALVCYGEEETSAALRLGAVDQLLVASSPGSSRSLREWGEFAAVVGASVVGVDPVDRASLRFCQGFGVGACLRYPLHLPSLEEEDPEETSPGFEEQKPPAAPAADSDCDTVSTATSQTDNVLIRWLREALKPTLQDVVAAESLALCAELVLFEEMTPVEERLDSALEMLRAEGVPEDVLIELACHVTDHFGICSLCGGSELAATA